MGRKTEWRIHATIGLLLVAITFTDLAPSGPWGDSTFTSGSAGLVGLCLLYMAWFRLTFDIDGLVPTLDRWNDPVKNSPKVVGVGVAIMGLAYGAGRIGIFPRPAGLILALIGLLTITNGAYVWLSTAGPWRDKMATEIQDQGIIPDIESDAVYDMTEDKNSGSSNITYNIQIHDSVVIDSKLNLEEE